jgi:mono/diheme cytochrome c family protein
MDSSGLGHRRSQMVTPTRSTSVLLGLLGLVGAFAACSSTDTGPFPDGAPTGDPGSPEFPFGPGGGSFDGSVPAFRGPSPVFANAASPAAVPISGGTLLVAADGHTMIASDPDRDVLYVGDMDAPAGASTLVTLALGTGDEPGRLVEDRAGRVHVALRRGGAVVTVDLAARTILARRDACPAPRGLAYDGSADNVIVACATGELVTFPASPLGAATRTVDLGRDLRDVVVTPTELLVTRFRTGDVLHVDAQGAIRSVETLAAIDAPPAGIPRLKDLQSMTPSIAWRMIPRHDGGALVVHQRGRTSLLQTTPGGYGGMAPCGAAIQGTVTVVGGGFATQTPGIGNAVLPVDIAENPDGKSFVLVAAGNAHTSELPTILRVAASASGFDQGPCIGGDELRPSGQPVAVAFSKDGRAVVQSREPASLEVISALDLTWTHGTLHVPSSPAPSREDTGHAIFHSNSGSGIACASCHPEAGDDGRSWRFPSGTRRTPSLRGTLAGTAPYHWAGDEADISALARDVFTGRMAGPPLEGHQDESLKSWLFALAAPPAAKVEPQARARGQALFESAAVGCATCHGGDKKTNNATMDVGTGGAFQVPSLVGVGWRTPLLHDGCAATLADRFGACATKGHGVTSQLSTQDVQDLIAYLAAL